MAELQDEVTQKNFKVDGMSKIFLNNIFELLSLIFKKKYLKNNDK